MCVVVSIYVYRIVRNFDNAFNLAIWGKTPILKLSILIFQLASSTRKYTKLKTHQLCVLTDSLNNIMLAKFTRYTVYVIKKTQKLVLY